MRNVLLAGSAVFLLSAGMAFAYNGSDHNSTPVVKNASVGGSGQSATTGGSNLSASLSNSANPSNSYNSSEAVSITKSLSNVGNETMVSTNTDTNISIASTRNEGSVRDITIGGAGGGRQEDGHKSGSGVSVSSGSNSMDTVNGGDGINTAMQNSGAASLQQNSVALGSVVNGSSGGTGISGF